MNSAKLNGYREKLLALRDRVGGEVNHVVESIHQEVDVSDEISAAPVHLADIAPTAIDADIRVLQTERGLFDQINAALDKLQGGEFGRCENCHAEIATERLEAIPYTQFCTACAELAEQNND